ncbi:MAG: nitroreductase family deazaflavin-dependent oxidoreductase [Anaerolineales bacterium]|nr:nitroreductase family deazaflavin-dependent oxidoreductase [Anaerolineales bacterium]NUQ85764.1 nitroreductase family deazaflavin-dependent oxidoreductase [Anaerolineales bacterium]
MNDKNPPLSPLLADEAYCYLTTTGRLTGKPHEIEIWFGLRGNTLYLLSGGMDRSDWVKNLRKTPSVTVRIGKHRFKARARLVEDKEEEMTARNVLADKYHERRANGALSNWARTALVVGIDLHPSEMKKTLHRGD